MLVRFDASAYTPAPFRPPPAECLSLLDLYSAGTTGVEDLRPVLRAALAPPQDEKAHIKYLLYQGIHSGIVKREDVVAALELEGCSSTPTWRNGVCFEVRQLLKYGPPRPTVRQSSEEAKDALLDSFHKRGDAALPLYAAYITALVSECRLSLPEAITILSTGEPPRASSAPVIQAYLVILSTSPAGSSRLRAAVASAFAARVRDDSAEALLDLRALPEGALDALWVEMDGFWPPLLDTRTRCLTQRLRARTYLPDRWQAQKDRLECDGLF